MSKVKLLTIFELQQVELASVFTFLEVTCGVEHLLDTCEHGLNLVVRQLGEQLLGFFHFDTQLLIIK